MLKVQVWGDEGKLLLELREESQDEQLSEIYDLELWRLRDATKQPEQMAEKEDLCFKNGHIRGLTSAQVCRYETT